MQAENARLERQLADTNKLLDNTNQPHHLLVSAVRARDMDLGAARAEVLFLLRSHVGPGLQTCCRHAVGLQTCCMLVFLWSCVSVCVCVRVGTHVHTGGASQDAAEHSASRAQPLARSVF